MNARFFILGFLVSLGSSSGPNDSGTWKIEYRYRAERIGVEEFRSIREEIPGWIERNQESIVAAEQRELVESFLDRQISGGGISPVDRRLAIKYVFDAQRDASYVERRYEGGLLVQYLFEKDFTASRRTSERGDVFDLLPPGGEPASEAYFWEQSDALEAVEAFVLSNGSTIGPSVVVDLEQLRIADFSGLLVPPWFSLCLHKIVLTRAGSPENYETTISWIDPEGRVFDELTGRQSSGHYSFVRRRTFFPFSTILRSEVTVQILEHSDSAPKMPGFSDFSSYPIEARELVDQRSRSRSYDPGVLDDWPTRDGTLDSARDDSWTSWWLVPVPLVGVLGAWILWRRSRA